MFREDIITVVLDDVALLLTNYDGQLTADDLISLVDQIEPVDEATWIERLEIAPLYKAPVHGLPTAE